MELGGFELATSWVRSADGTVTLLSYALALEFHRSQVIYVPYSEGGGLCEASQVAHYVQCDLATINAQAGPSVAAGDASARS